MKKAGLSQNGGRGRETGGFLKIIFWIIRKSSETNRVCREQARIIKLPWQPEARTQRESGKDITVELQLTSHLLIYFFKKKIIPSNQEEIFPLA